jgi:hypothetical protein
MPMADAEMERLCREIFGDPLDERRRAWNARVADAYLQSSRELAEHLDPASEPAGYDALLRRMPLGG